jgi:hypothetical protein
MTIKLLNKTNIRKKVLIGVTVLMEVTNIVI